jgi:hypothetical protein
VLLTGFFSLSKIGLPSRGSQVRDLAGRAISKKNSQVLISVFTACERLATKVTAEGKANDFEKPVRTL